MKLVVCTLLLIGITICSLAQTPGISFSAKYGGASDDRFVKVIQLANGNYVCSGFTYSTNGHAAGNHGGTDFFIVCISQQGELLWRKLIGGTVNDGGSYSGNGELLSPSADGGFFFAGATSSYNGDIPQLKGSWDIFVARFDQDGNMLWKKTYGGNRTEWVSGLLATEDGGCIIASSSDSHNNGEVPANHSLDIFDAWIFKVSASGTIEWSKMFGGTNHEISTSIAKASNGGYVFTANVTSGDGDLAGTVAPGAFRKTDVWAVKINDTGMIQWSRRIGGSSDDAGAQILTSSSGDYYILASSSSADGDLTSHNGLSDLMFARLTNSGIVSFVKTFGGTAHDSGSALAEAADGNILITGITYSLKINNIPIPFKGTNDILLLKVGKLSGDLLWITSIGGSLGDFSSGMIRSRSDETVIVGHTSSFDVDFQKNLGGRDAFFMKIAPFNAIKGYVFYDYNGNGVKNTNEPYVYNARITTTKGNSYGVSNFTTEGTYFTEVDTGTFVTKPRLFNYNYYAVNPDSFVTTFSEYYGSVERNIAVKPVPGKRDLQTVLVALDPARAGFNSSYRMICFNAGTDTVSAGTARFVKDPRTTFLSAHPLQNNIIGDTIFWPINNLKPLDSLQFDIELKLANPPTINIGDWMRYRSIISPVENDLVPGDNKFLLYHFVVGAFDPNDKNETSGNFYSSINLANNDFLTYTIRFQNTGTDTAFNVIIKDTLDSKLDAASFRLLNTSHAAKLSITNNVCTWKFADINLPDSNRNEPGSHGFITYQLKPSAGVALGDTIKNAASIYFDFNLPIKTNTHLTIVRLPVPPEPEIDNLSSSYCSNQGVQKIKLVNLPGPEYGASVLAKIDNIDVPITTDSIITIEVSKYNAGEHTLSVTYTNTTESQGITQNFEVLEALAPEVNLTANKVIVVSLTDTVIITANNVSGGGQAPTYLFARDRAFANITQAESGNNEFSFQSSILTVGDNWFYVKMKTSDTCYLTEVNVDSINIHRSTLTNIPDPQNPGSFISVSPNPFSNELIIKRGNANKLIYYTLHSATGAKLLQAKSIGQTNIIINPRLNPGAYFLTFYDNTKRKIGTVTLIRK